MKAGTNKHAEKATRGEHFEVRLSYFFCTACQARREAVDEGDPFPVCVICGLRRMERRTQHAEKEAPKFKPNMVPVDERTEQAAPVVQTKRKFQSPRELAREVLTELVTDLEAALENDSTYHAMLHGVLNPFVLELVNVMVIDRIDWRGAVAQLSKEFCLRFRTELEEFNRWAEDPSAFVPHFIEPNPTPYDPLAAKESGPGRRSIPSRSGIP